MAFFPTDLGGWLGAASAVSNLFGGSKSEGDSMKSQYAWNAYSTLMNPHWQVEGLKKAGLNPMLAVSKGLNSAAPITASPGAQDNSQSQRMMAISTAANQAAQAKMYSAQAALLEKQGLTEEKRPANIEQDTRTKEATMRAQGTLADLQGEMYHTQTWQTKIKLTEHYLTKLEYELKEVNLPALRKAEMEKAVADAKTAKNEAELNVQLRKLERIIAMGSEATGAVTGGIGRLINSAIGGRRLFGK